MQQPSVGALYLEAVTRNFRGLKSYADRAIEQIDDEQLHVAPDPHSSPVSVIVKHLGGNLRSRWTDFLTTDGEKGDRHREREFEKGLESRDELLANWNEGWACLFDALAALEEPDLAREVTIRGEALPAVAAINRALQHCAYHVGQIVYVAKHLKGENWSALS